MLSEVKSRFAKMARMEDSFHKTLAKAYKKASSKSSGDAEVRYLKRMGVLLPNGFTPLPPLHDVFGEELLSEMSPK